MATPEPPTADHSVEESHNGEVIYSDAGVAPSGVSKPPLVVQQQAAGDSGSEAVLSSEQVSPLAAFEVFQGRVYNASVVPSVPAFAGATTEQGASLPPLARLARLQQEVGALEEELAATAKASDGGRAFDEEIVKLATDLKHRLAAASSAHANDQDDLTRRIRQQLEEMGGSGRGAGAPEPAPEELPATGLVYELYGNASNPTTTLEERLLNLERVLGDSQQHQQQASSSSSQAGPSSTVSSSNYKSVLHRLEDMEQLLATVDASTLEKTATKAKVIRADLEAASKARNKLTATYKKEDSKMIQQLYQQMIDLEGLGNYLPHLVERLRQLSGLHQQASTFGSRLSELEKEATQVESTIGQLEAGMATLETTIAQNIAAMEGNMKKLDEKLAALS